MKLLRARTKIFAARANPDRSRSSQVQPDERIHPAKKEVPMFLIIALVLVLLWIGGFVVFHTAGFLIHLLLLLAVISIIFHFLRGRSSTA
jgi:Family of unknown function (DUF5670)